MQIIFQNRSALILSHPADVKLFLKHVTVSRFCVIYQFIVWDKY